MSGRVVVLDACVLLPIRLATTLLWLAEAGMLQPLWSDQILNEVQRNLPRVGVTPKDASRRIGMMRDAFGAASLVDDFDHLIDRMDCEAKDRHVLAAAVRGGADAIVTFNVKDFPPDSAATHKIEILHPDLFLLGLLAKRTDVVVAALERETAAFRNPPKTVVQFLAALTPTVPMFANLPADALQDLRAPLSIVPELVGADVGAFDNPGDLTDPGHVALAWWRGLLNDLDLARELTCKPSTWGDYQWAIDHLAGRSPASKVIRAVDAPDRIAFVRFMSDVVTASRMSGAYLTRGTFLTLVRVEDLTWRVWGLGPSVPSAGEILG